MKRRTFIAGLGSVAAWPVVARAQQPALPVIGYLSARSPESDVVMLAAFHRGLAEIVTHITSELAFEKKDGCVTYFNGHMPVFTHGEKDVATFRMITSQFCVSGYAKQIRRFD